MRYGTAVILLLIATSLSSLNGIFVNSFEGMTDWQIVFWRHLLVGIAMFAGLMLVYRRRFAGALRSQGWIGLGGAFAFGLSTLLVTMAQHHAPVADVMFVLASVPFLTALLAWVILREVIHTITWFGLAGAATGIVVMVLGNLGNGNMTGTLLGIGAALMIATFAVILRWGKAIDMIPMFALGCLIAAAIALPFTFDDLWFDTKHLPLLLVWAAVISPTYYALFVISSRYIPGGELMLSLAVETIEAAILAWLILSQVPTQQTFIGGAIIMGSVGVLAFFRIRQEHKS
jgi:drug/metabolite transporter (DMT)-like permease